MTAPYVPPQFTDDLGPPYLDANYHNELGNALKRAIDAINDLGLGGGGTATKQSLGLDKVDNTADADKPISSATQTALDKKPDITLITKVDGYRANLNLAAADNSGAIESAIAAAVEAGARKVLLPPGRIDITQDIDILNTQISTTGIELIGHAQGTEIRLAGGALSKGMINARGADGTKVALTSALPAGTQTITTLPAAVTSTLTTGSILGLESTLKVWGLQPDAESQLTCASEFHRVISVSGSTVIIDSPLIFDYTVEDSATAWKITPINRLAIRNIVFTSIDPTTYRLRSVWINKGSEIEITDCAAVFAGGGVIINDSVDVLVSNYRADRLPTYGDFRGYGLAASGRTSKMLVENIRGQGCRHVFTTLAEYATDGSVVGGPRDVRIVNGIGESDGTYAVWDTHPQGYNISFVNCSASGGAGSGAEGFQIRCDRVSLVNPTAIRCGGNGVAIQSTSRHARIVGGDLSHNKSSGVKVNGQDAHISDVTIVSNDGPGLVIGDNAVRARVRDNNIANNLNYGIHDQSTGLHTGVFIGPDNIIPKSTRQASSILSPKSDMFITSNYFLGYGTDNDGITGTVSSSIKKMANINDTTDLDSDADGQISPLRTYGLKGWTFDLVFATGGFAPVAGQAYLAQVDLLRYRTCTNIVFRVSTAGAGVSNAYVALVDASGAVLAKSADISASLASAGFKSVALLQNVVRTTVGPVYAVLLIGAASTMPNINRAPATAITANFLLTAAVRRFMLIGSGLTAMPESFDLSTSSSTSDPAWFGVL